MLKVELSVMICMFLLGLYVLAPNFGIKTPFPAEKLSLGFDLKGGSSLLLKADLDYALKEQLDILLDNIKHILNSKKINFTKAYSSNGIIIMMAERSQLKQIHDVLAAELSGKVVHNIVGEHMEIRYSQSHAYELAQNIIRETIKNLRKRVDELGTKEAMIYSYGSDGFVVQMPGIYNPDTLKKVIGKTAKLTFHIMAEKGALNTMVVTDKQGNKFFLDKKIALSGDLFNSVSINMNKMGKPTIALKFNTLGTKRFSDITKQNIKKSLAIVLDGILLTNPIINEHIADGQAEISGNFNAQEARELVALLRSGSLPAPLSIAEERVLGPSLGLESINQSIMAGLYAFFLVVSIMWMFYGLFGLFAIISLVFNVVLLLSVLALCNITITLPGIAGLILTIGMAVDTNILIFERMKDENKNKQSLYRVIERGFKYAKSTIVDSNLTTLIASMIMLIFGNSSIKGFAITLSVGIVSSLMSGIFVTHNIIKLWFSIKHPARLPMGFLLYNPHNNHGDDEKSLNHNT